MPSSPSFGVSLASSCFLSIPATRIRGPSSSTKRTAKWRWSNWRSTTAEASLPHRHQAYLLRLEGILHRSAFHLDCAGLLRIRLPLTPSQSASSPRRDPRLVRLKPMLSQMVVAQSMSPSSGSGLCCLTSSAHAGYGASRHRADSMDNHVGLDIGTGCHHDRSCVWQLLHQLLHQLHRLTQDLEAKSLIVEIAVAGYDGISAWSQVLVWPASQAPYRGFHPREARSQEADVSLRHVWLADVDRTVGARCSIDMLLASR